MRKVIGGREGFELREAVNGICKLLIRIDARVPSDPPNSPYLPPTHSVKPWAGWYPFRLFNLGGAVFYDMVESGAQMRAVRYCFGCCVEAALGQQPLGIGQLARRR